ncbi:MAG: UvrD-helicase domain-containing protein [Bryobacteraceae bacterium]
MSDGAARERALDPSRSFIVQAPAGSGKTELLIQRYLVLLARVEQPESVVAITFTRKAAGEMRRRVLDALRDAAGPKPEKPHAAQTWELARAVRARNQAERWEIYSNPNRLRIRTIDSLCASLARQMPWLSRMGGPPDVVEDAGVLYAEAARRTVELLESHEWTAQVETLLLHLDNNFQKLADLLAEMLARRDQWLRHVAGGPSRQALEAALARIVEEHVARLRAAIPPELAREMAALARFARPACAGLHSLPGAENMAAWLEIADMLLTQKGEWRKRLTRANGFPPGAGKARCEALIAALGEDVRAALDHLRVLPDTRFPDAQWQALEALCRLLPMAAAQLQLLFRERGEADFAEFAMAASRALGEPEAPTDLALALDYRVQHLLVDEFQDTSVAQFDLLERLTAGWEPGDGRTLFLVGDPMQSIYRFREAEVGLFLKAQREGIGQTRLEPLKLSANFRSDAGIVNWVNRVFPEVLAGAEDMATGAVPFSESVARRPAGKGCAVTIHPFLGADPAAEAARVVEIVRAAKGLKTAILVRARTHLEEIVPALRAAGLRFRAVDIDCLAETPVVQDLLALTRALLHPGDRIAWLAVLRAPWCGLTLADLHALAADQPDAAVWDLVCDPERPLSPGGRARLERTRDALGNALSRRPLSLRDWIERAWLDLGGPACATGPGDLDNASAYFDLVEKLEDGGRLDLAVLHDSTLRLFARPDPRAGDSLQLMTIHKAKGLEFDCVILPGLGRPPRHDDPRLMLWLERPRLAGEPDLLLAPIHAPGSADKIYDYLSSIESAKGAHEAGRLLYVACTRAMRQLHLLGHVPVNDAGEMGSPAATSLLARLWHAVEPEFAGIPAPLPLMGEVDRAPVFIRRLTLEWRLPAPPPVAPGAAPEPAATGERLSFRWVGDTLRHTGTVVHALLRRIAEEGPASWDRARVEACRTAIETALLTLGVPRADVPEAAAQVSAAVAGTLEDPRGLWILTAHDRAACEFPLTGIVDGKLAAIRVDRTFVAEGARWIVDYKTSAHQGGALDAFLDNERERYRSQLDLYRAVFEQYEDLPVRAALYFPLLKGWREIPAPAKGVHS